MRFVLAVLSTAWVTALMNVCAFFTSLGNEQLQLDVWGSNPDARISSWAKDCGGPHCYGVPMIRQLGQLARMAAIPRSVSAVSSI